VQVQFGLGQAADEGLDFVHLISLRSGVAEFRELTAKRTSSGGSVGGFEKCGPQGRNQRS
jgi:hypothetical protein